MLGEEVPIGLDDPSLTSLHLTTVSAATELPQRWLSERAARDARVPPERKPYPRAGRQDGGFSRDISFRSWRLQAPPACSDSRE